ncbi:MAG: phosphotransferase [Streptococcus sp.]|nr:phosphotransferase [Streptococcus sp.]
MTINFNFPKKIQKYLNGLSYQSDSVGQSSANILIFENYVLKIQEVCEEAENEVFALKWLKNKIAVPELFEYVIEDNKLYLLMERIKTTSINFKNLDLVTTMLANILKRLWMLDISTFSKKTSLLEAASYNIEKNLIDMNHVQPETFGKSGFRTPSDLLAWLEENKPKGDLVFTHGDFTLANILINDNQLGTLIDLGKSGPADRWQDIAICLRSLYSNIEKHYPNLYDKETIQNMILDKLQIPLNKEKLNYYILLDELF